MQDQFFATSISFRRGLHALFPDLVSGVGRGVDGDGRRQTCRSHTNKSLLPGTGLTETHLAVMQRKPTLLRSTLPASKLFFKSCPSERSHPDGGPHATHTRGIVSRRSLLLDCLCYSEPGSRQLQADCAEDLSDWGERKGQWV